MRYYNRDGSTGMMCGNGGRCAVRFAVEHGYVNAANEIIFANAGIPYRAVVTERGVKVWFPDPRSFALALEVDLDGKKRRCHFADVGTPHAIMFVDDAGDSRSKRRLRSVIPHASAVRTRFTRPLSAP